MKIKESAVQRHRRIKKDMTSFTFRLTLVLILLLELDYSTLLYYPSADLDQQCSFFEIRRETSQARFQPGVEVST